MKKRLLICINILNIFSIIYLVINLFNNFLDEVLHVTIIIAIFEIVQIFKFKYFCNINFKNKASIFSIILTLLFLIMLPIKYVYEGIYNINIFFNIITYSIITISIIFSLFYLIYFLFTIEMKNKITEKKLKKFFIIFLIIYGSLFTFSTLTGFVDADFNYIWTDINKNMEQSWHTFAFNNLIRFSFNILGSPFLVVLFQYILFIHFIIYSFNLLDKYIKNNTIMIIYFLILIFMIPIFDSLRYVIKDVIFSYALVNLILVLFDYYCSKKLSLINVIRLCIFNAIFIIFRHEGIYLSLFLFITIVIIELCSKKLLNTFLFIDIILFGITINIWIQKNNEDKYNFNNMSSMRYLIPLYQVGAFSNDNYEFTDEEVEYLKNFFEMEEFKEKFNRYLADPYIVEMPESFDYSKLIEINFRMFINRPLNYLKNLLNISNINWKIESKNNYEFIYFIRISTSGWDKIENIIYYEDENETFLNNFTNIIIDKGLKNCFYDIMARGGFSFFMIILSTCILMYKRRYIFFVAISSIFYRFILLTLIMPASHTRYIFIYILAFPFILCFSLGITKNNKT